MAPLALLAPTSNEEVDSESNVRLVSVMEGPQANWPARDSLGAMKYSTPMNPSIELIWTLLIIAGIIGIAFWIYNRGEKRVLSHL